MWTVIIHEKLVLLFERFSLITNTFKSMYVINLFKTDLRPKASKQLRLIVLKEFNDIFSKVIQPNS